MKPKAESKPLTLRDMADAYMQIQRTRIAAENRVRASVQGADKSVQAQIISSDPVITRLRESEVICQTNMEALLPLNPTYEWMMGVPGINRTIAAKILGLMDDPRNFARFSNLRTFAGLTPGKNRLVKGEKAVFSNRLKTTLFVAFSSILKSASSNLSDPPAKSYAEIYQNWRGIYKHRYGEGPASKKNKHQDQDGVPYSADDEVAKEWPDLRQYYAAKNKLLDVFLYHIYEEWLEKGYGITAAGLYVHDVLGHHMKFERVDFSSPEMSKKKQNKHAKELTAV